MKKSKIEAAATRRRIVKAANLEFCRNGIRATGLVDLMASAGLTQGGFYKHFRSKDQVIAEACAAGMVAVAEVAKAAAERGHGKGGLEEIVDSYLSMDHRDMVDGGCPLHALGSELAHADDQVRATVTEGLLKFADVIAQQFTRTKPKAAQERALFVISAMVGAMTLSRMVTDQNLSAAILEQTRKRLTKR